MPAGRRIDAQAIAALINAAFSNVTLGNGVGLREAQGIDDHENAEACAAYRAKDEKNDWRRIPVEELNTCYSSLSFFDAEGMRFHLPAFLVAGLGGGYLQDLSFQLAYLNDYSIGQYALLSPAQRNAVRACLQFLLEEESHADSHAQIVSALNEYWTEQS